MFGSPIKSTIVCAEEKGGLLTEMRKVHWTEKSIFYQILIQFHNDNDSFLFQLCITKSLGYQQIYKGMRKEVPLVLEEEHLNQSSV